MPKPLVIQSEELDAQPAAWLAQHCELIACPFDDAGRFSELLPDASGLLVRTYTRVTGPMLDGARSLRVVGRAGVGVDNIDLGQCASRGITVVHTPEANTSAVAEYVTALMFDALRPRVFIDKPLAKPAWCSLRDGLVARRQLCEMTLGILGMGRIGQRVATIAGALGMKVLYHDLVEIPDARRFGGARPVSRDELLASADILTVHIDGREENRRLIGGEVLRQMRDDAVLINTSRGMVIDAYALADHMLTHPRAQALLDVHDPEPIEATSPLLDIPNVRLSPHIAACTEAAHRNMGWVVKDVWRVLSGQKPEFPAV